MVLMMIMITTIMFRKGDPEITICPGQDVRQEEKLSQFRMKVNMIIIAMVVHNDGCGCRPFLKCSR